MKKNAVFFVSVAIAVGVIVFGAVGNASLTGFLSVRTEMN